MRITLFIALFLSGFISSCTQESEWKLNNINSTYIPVDSSSIASADQDMLAEIVPYKQKMDSAMGGVIAFSEKEYFKNKPNGLLNNITCDMVFDVIVKRYKDSPFKPDLCLLNYGGLRRPLPKGNITRSDIFQLMPFQNESVICRLSGKQMNNMFDYLIKSNGQPIANMIVNYQDSIFIGAFINGIAYDSSKTYNVLTSDYTAKGGDRMNFFLNADTMILCGSLLRNDMFTYIDELKDGKLIANDELRIIIK